MHGHRTWVEINSRALTNNIDALRSLLAPEARFCAVVKANAYGHGLEEVISIVGHAGVDAFAVDTIDDALLIQEKFPSSLILVLGYTMFERYREAIRAGIHLTLYDKEGIEQAQRVGTELARPFMAHIKVETGTNRQGVTLRDLDDIIRLLKRSDRVQVEGISTHFANIEDSHNPEFATVQFRRFQEIIDRFAQGGIQPLWRHCACSAAIILYPQTQLNFVRAGISMYGLWSSEIVQDTVRSQGFACDLQPTLAWKSRIAQIKSVAMGEPIGYGLTEVMKRSGRLAVVPVGYWDGYDRRLSGRGEMLVRGTRCKVLGRVCMNMTMIDVSQVPDLHKEDEVLLLGTDGRHRISADDLAGHCETISYEIVARINPTIPRIVV